MAEIKMNVRALAANMKISIDKLAELAGINAQHLKDVSSGRTTMTARDLIKLAQVTNVSPYNIDIGE